MFAFDQATPNLLDRLKGDDAWLVLDRNSNGTFDFGCELFGADTIVTDRTTGQQR